MIPVKLKPKHILRTFISLLSISFKTASCFQCDLPQVEAVLTRTVQGEGFHRVLQTNFTIKGNIPASYNVGFLSKEQLPSTLYVDQFEVTSATHSGRDTFQLYFPTYTDIEKPAHQSGPQTVYVFHNSTFQVDNNGNMATTWISYTTPFHIKYQKAYFPSNELSNFAEVTLPIPEIYIMYEDYKHTKECKHLYWRDIADATGLSYQNWLRLNVTSPDPRGLAIKLYVPRGNLELSTPVTILTLLTVISCCIYVCVVIATSKNKMKNG